MQDCSNSQLVQFLKGRSPVCGATPITLLRNDKQYCEDGERLTWTFPSEDVLHLPAKEQQDSSYLRPGKCPTCAHFQIPQRTTHKSCLSSFLTEGDPHVVQRRGMMRIVFMAMSFNTVSGEKGQCFMERLASPGGGGCH